MKGPIPMRRTVPEGNPSAPVNGADGQRRMPHQQDLPFGAESHFDYWWRKVLKAAAEAVEEIGLKDVAFHLDISKSAIEHALAERNYNHLRADHLVFLAMNGRSEGISEAFAAMRGKKLEPTKALTPEEELALYKRAIAKAGPATQAFVESEVYGDSTEPYEKL